MNLQLLLQALVNGILLGGIYAFSLALITSAAFFLFLRRSRWGIALRATAFGHHLGVAYQIIDDVLDIESWNRRRDAFGKQSGKDLHTGVYLLPVLIALESSPHLARILGRPLDAQNVEQAVALMGNEPLDAARRVAMTHVELAHDSIEPLRDVASDTVSAMQILARRLSQCDF